MTRGTNRSSTRIECCCSTDGNREIHRPADRRSGTTKSRVTIREDRRDRWTYTAIEWKSIGIDGEGAWIDDQRLRSTESDDGRGEANQLDENGRGNDTNVGERRRAKGRKEMHRHGQLDSVETVFQRSRWKEQFGVCQPRLQIDRRCARRIFTRPDRPFNVHGQRPRTVQFDHRHDGKGFTPTERSSDSWRRTGRAQSDHGR